MGYVPIQVSCDYRFIGGVMAFLVKFGPFCFPVQYNTASDYAFGIPIHHLLFENHFKSSPLFDLPQDDLPVYLRKLDVLP